jgi:hypothetical protein
MRLAVLAGFVGLVLSVAAAQAAVPATGVPVAALPAAGATQPCEPGRIDPPASGTNAACVIDEDVTGIAARLLVVKFGTGATAFAEERVARYAAENDPESAALWRGIAATAAALIKSP